MEALEASAVGVPWQAREVVLGEVHAALRGEGRAQSKQLTRGTSLVPFLVPLAPSFALFPWNPCAPDAT